MHAKKLQNSEFLRQTSVNSEFKEEFDPLRENRKYVINN